MTDAAEDFEEMWRTLAPLGRSSSSGGYFRAPFTAVEAELRAWFLEQCEARGLEVEADGNGNLLGWWFPPTVELSPSVEPVETTPPAAVLIGSHLDSVLDGGAYDGPLGVVSSLAAIDRLRERGVVPRRPVAVAMFAEEEGSRFGIACLGSRLASGGISPQRAGELRDRAGVPLLDAMASAGVEPSLGRAGWLDRIGCFVELHVEQGRDLVHREAAVGLATGIWPHGRYRFEFAGTADHAGTTRMEDRHDPMLTFAATALAAQGAARDAGARATFGRVDVAPNGTNAIPSRVTAWLDARGESEAELTRLVAGIERQAADRAGHDGTGLSITAESESGAVAFDPDLTGRLAEALRTRWGSVPHIPTMAGHDAGILAGAGVPSAMMFVRNPTGVSHSPLEHAEPADCLAGVEALSDALEGLLG